MRIEVPRAALGPERLERPFSLRLMMSHDICVAVIGSDAEIDGIRRVPLIFNALHEQHDIAQPEFDRPLVRFVPGIAFDAKLHTVS